MGGFIQERFGVVLNTDINIARNTAASSDYRRQKLKCISQRATDYYRYEEQWAKASRCGYTSLRSFSKILRLKVLEGFSPNIPWGLNISTRIIAIPNIIYWKKIGSTFTIDLILSL